MSRNETVLSGEERNEDVILEVRNASVSFDMDRGQSRVLNDVSIDIRREEILGVVGESGSGKSMFASALLDAVVDPGVLTGEITYHTGDGEPVDLLDLSDRELKSLRWEEISMVFQGAQSSFNPTMVIRKHFKETLRAHDADVEAGLEYAHELLSDLYLDPERVMDSYPHELSGGMKQRALIALSLVLDPEVLVMDEPTAALDLLMQRSILRLLKNLQEKYDLTVVFITHDLPLIADLTDRVAVMYAFEFAEIGSAEDIIDEPAHPYTRALLRAVPNLETPLSMMEPIEGSSPDPVNIPQGCSYHPRCPLADETCENKRPPFYDISENQSAACFHWEESADTIPLSTVDRDADGVERFTGTQSEEPVVSLNDLTIHFEQSTGGLLNVFDDPEIVHAVDDVSLDIYENDVVVLVGESGCGKTTLGRAAIGTLRPTNGRVTYRNQDVWDAKDRKGDVKTSFSQIRQSLQMIHQDPGSALNPNRTVRASLSVPLKRKHPQLTSDDRAGVVLDMLERVGMTPPEDYAQRYPHQLSGGEKQRVALVRALLMNPDVILADEAVSALDVSLRVDMMDIMLDLQEQFGTSFLFISHNLSNARYLAGKAGGRIGVMYLGELVEIGPAEEIIENPQHPYTKVLKWSTPKLEGQDVKEPPIRGIDIPDSVDIPSGCRFHTRCPDAREVCTRQAPELTRGAVESADRDHCTACFRDYPADHEYWESDPLEERDDGSRPT